MALHDLVCPHCQSGLVVDTNAGNTATVGETVAIVSHASPEDMAQAVEAMASAREQAIQGAITHAEALAKMEAARVAHRLAGLVGLAKAEAPAPEEAPADVPADAPETPEEAPTEVESGEAPATENVEVTADA
jgi:hypothetical protein